MALCDPLVTAVALLPRDAEAEVLTTPHGSRDRGHIVRPALPLLIGPWPPMFWLMGQSLERLE
jgi:hypothetical protein